MRSVILMLTVAIGLGACGGKEVHLKQKDGTWKPTLMTPQEEIEMRTGALHDGVSYLGDCHNGDDSTYPNEGVFYETVANNTGECTYVGGGSATTWDLTFDDSVARFISSGRSMNNNVSSYKFRAASWPLGNTRIAIHLSETFGGGYIAEFTGVPNGQERTANDFGVPRTGSSAIMSLQ